MSTVEDLLIEAYSHWDDAETLARTGRELQSRTRLEAAREILTRAIELRPDSDPDSWARLSFAQFRDGQGVAMHANTAKQASAGTSHTRCHCPGLSRP